MTDATVRPERPADAAAVRAVLHAAFAGPLEANMVERLRADGDLVLGLVAEHARGAAGFVGFARLAIKRDDTTVPAVGLAPLGVVPPLQRKKIGAALVRVGLSRLKAMNETIVFVLGDPAYYRRFGFAVLPAFVSRYAGPYFQALRLTDDAPKSGTVIYPGPFNDLG